MKRFFEFLFYYNYHHQVKVGNEDIAVFMSWICISLGIVFYSLTLFSFISFFIFHLRLPSYIAMSFSYSIALLLGIYIYISLIYKKKYLKLVLDKSRYKKKYRFVPIIFMAIGGFSFIGVMFLVCARNNGLI